MSRYEIKDRPATIGRGRAIGIWDASESTYAVFAAHSHGGLYTIMDGAQLAQNPRPPKGMRPLAFTLAQSRRYMKQALASRFSGGAK